MPYIPIDPKAAAKVRALAKRRRRAAELLAAEQERRRQGDAAAHADRQRQAVEQAQRDQSYREARIAEFNMVQGPPPAPRTAGMVALDNALAAIRDHTEQQIRRMWNRGPERQGSNGVADPWHVLASERIDGFWRNPLIPGNCPGAALWANRAVNLDGAAAAETIKNEMARARSRLRKVARDITKCLTSEEREKVHASLKMYRDDRRLQLRGVKPRYW